MLSSQDTPFELVAVDDEIAVGRIEDDDLHEVDQREEHERRDVEHAGVRHVAAYAAQRRLGDPVDEVDNGVVRIGVDPGDDDTGEQDVLVHG